MLITLFLAAICVVLTGVVVANCVLNNTNWYLCPRCWHWHSDIGERSEKAPMYGSLRNESRVCRCCRKVN